MISLSEINRKQVDSHVSTKLCPWSKAEHMITMTLMHLLFLG